MLELQEIAPIGIFDSGVGGLTVWEEVVKLLPGNSILYFADSAYAPYGPKSREEVIERSKKISQFFISQGVGVIVVACNTATSAAITTLRDTFDIPFVGVEPAIKPAAALSKTGVIGVLATKGTLSAPLYHRTLKLFASQIKVIEVIGSGLVPLIESGKSNSAEVEELLKKYIPQMVDEGADYIVLGCTHYPFIKNKIEKIAGEAVTIIDPAPSVARQLYKIVSEQQMIANNSQQFNTIFYSSGKIDVLKQMVRENTPQLPDKYFITKKLT